MNYVGIPKRAVAVIVDGILYCVLAWLIAMVTGDTTEGGFSLSGTPALLSFLIYLGYHVGLEGTSGQTVGKKLVGIKVVNAEGGPIGFGPALIRNLLRMVDGFLLYLVGAIFVATSDTKQRLGDIAAKTFVVKA